MKVLTDNGWTRAQWDALTEDEQEERLAYALHRRKYVDDVIEALKRYDKLSVDPYTMLMLARM